MRLAIRTGAIATLSVAAMSLGTPLALAHGNAGGDNSGAATYGASYDRGDGRDGVRAASYINRDTGAATENADVDRGSSCASPDQRDKQRLSDPGTANRNVHNDACFLDPKGQKVNGPASFQSSGVGFISACPTPTAQARSTPGSATPTGTAATTCASSPATRRPAQPVTSSSTPG